MIAASAIDYRELARRRLPHFLFECVDNGSYGEVTLRRNVADLGRIALRQRVLRNLALGARGMLLGRACVHTLAARGRAGIEHLLKLIEAEMRVGMGLTGVTSNGINRSILAEEAP